MGTAGFGGPADGGTGAIGVGGMAGGVASGGAGGASSGTAWCSLQPAHTLCSDFDTAGALSVWTEYLSSGNESASGDMSVSAPKSLDAKVSPSAASDTAMAFLSKAAVDSAPVPVGALDLHFSVNVPQLPTVATQTIEIGRVRFGTVYTELGWVGGQFQIFVDDVGDPSHAGSHIGSFPIAPLAANTWNSITLSIIEGPNNDGSIGLTVNDTAPQSIQSVTTVAGDIASWGVDIGIVESGGVGAFEAHYDNVTIDRY